MADEKSTQAVESRVASKRLWKYWEIYLTVAMTLAMLGYKAWISLHNISTIPARNTAPDFSGLSDHCAHVRPIPNKDYIARQDELAQTLHSLGASAYIAEPGANAAFYANISSSNWGLSERPLLLIVTPFEENGAIKGNISILTPAFEATRARLLPVPSDEEIGYHEWAEDADPYDVAISAIPALQHKNGTIFVDGGIRQFVVDGIQHAAKGSLITTAPVEVRRLRERKSKEELEIMKCVNEVTVLAIRAARKGMFIGMRESEARSLIVSALQIAGLRDASSITLFGPNAALPHGSGTDRVLEASDYILVDCGGSLYGYHSDVTRTFALDTSSISEDHLNLWDLVYAAQTAAIKSARNGTVTKEVDHAARRIIGEEGYGGYFTHRLGHGIGLEVHESPYLRGGSNDVILTGNTFSDEPGVYIEGEVGVRLEDCFYIDESGAAVFLTAGVGGQAGSAWEP